jgi:hypothetical protein
MKPVSALALKTLVVSVTVAACFAIACKKGTLAEPTVLLPSDTTLLVQHGSCSAGTCPVYEITITADGRVAYNGIANVATRGHAEAAVHPLVVLQFIDRFMEINFFNYEEYYINSGDCPNFLGTGHADISISLTIDGFSKKVMRNSGCSGFTGEENLIQLQNLIEEAVNVKRWINP